MFRIIGADKQQYGPVGLEVVRQWIAEGRADGRTLVQGEGRSEWQPLANVPELAALLTRAAETSLPPAAAPAGSLPGPGQPGTPGGAPTQFTSDAFARAAVRVPAILLIVAGGVGPVAGSLGLVQHLAGPGMIPLPPEIPPELARLIRQMSGLPVALAGMVLDLVMVVGGLSMLNPQRWGLALASSLIALVGGNPRCCPISLAGGIWSLAKPLDPAVKSTFH